MLNLKDVKELAEELVVRDIHCRCNDMVRELTNAYYNNIKVEAIDIDSLEEQLNTEDEDGNYPEVMQFWIVTNFLGERLKKQGEIITEFEDGYVWGRRGYGYALADDLMDVARDIIKVAKGL